VDIYAINYIGRRDKKLSDPALLLAFYPSSVFSPLLPRPKWHKGFISPKIDNIVFPDFLQGHSLHGVILERRQTMFYDHELPFRFVR
jgi:hypothetical protein